MSIDELQVTLRMLNINYYITKRRNFIRFEIKNEYKRIIMQLLHDINFEYTIVKFEPDNYDDIYIFLE